MYSKVSEKNIKERGQGCLFLLFCDQIGMQHCQKYVEVRTSRELQSYGFCGPASLRTHWKISAKISDFLSVGDTEKLQHFCEDRVQSEPECTKTE